MPTNKLQGGAIGMNAPGNVLSAKVSQQSDGKHVEPCWFDDLGCGLIMVDLFCSYLCKKTGLNMQSMLKHSWSINTMARQPVFEQHHETSLACHILLCTRFYIVCNCHETSSGKCRCKPLRVGKHVNTVKSSSAPPHGAVMVQSLPIIRSHVPLVFGLRGRCVKGTPTQYLGTNRIHLSSIRVPCSLYILELGSSQNPDSPKSLTRQCNI